MIFALLVAITTCCAAWFLTGQAQKRSIGYLCGLADAVLWLFAGVSAGKLFVVLVAALCALCFARPFLRVRLYSRLRRQHG
ncbi:hypothetical protein [Paraburkholderia domus]|uniref:hypothetical protein n=1 Tax=Paraburkholderia domus TaxID=2793075 RepID=UPI001911A4E4|nr:hypothetical protein [Paraburkholderia domus]MBK5058922.1 hypothetical protein [Burkholderia sp. R-70199]CAE6880386.1 hypothetical protein R70199_02493 [Paraburkholderia domus]